MKEIGSQPGVLAAGVVNNVPFSGSSGKSAATVKGLRAAGLANHREGTTLMAWTAIISPPWASPCGQADSSTADDSRRAERFCVVDEDFARYYWPHASALGAASVRWVGREEHDAEAFTVVGVVGAVKQAGLTDDVAQGAVYYPYSFATDDSIFVVVRTSLPPESLALALQKAVRQIDPELPVSDIQTDADTHCRQPGRAPFSGIAGRHLLGDRAAAHGCWHLWRAELRRDAAPPRDWCADGLGRELRNRSAASSSRSRFACWLPGPIFGVIGAWLAGQAMRTVLFHVPAFHIATLAAAAGIIGIVSLVACLVPSIRAARISPTVALAE